MRKLGIALALAVAATLVISTPAMAQAAKKKQRQRISPHETITATIDGNELKLVYGRPYTKKPGTDRGPQDLGRAGPLRQGLAHGRRRGDPAHDQGADRDRRLLARRRARTRCSPSPTRTAPPSSSSTRRPASGAFPTTRNPRRPTSWRGWTSRRRLSTRRSTSSRWRSSRRPAAACVKMMWENTQYSVAVHREEVRPKGRSDVAYFHRGPTVRPRWTSQLRGLAMSRTTTLPRVEPARRLARCLRPGRGPAGRADLRAAVPRNR